jgi:hypothetical protein
MLLYTESQRFFLDIRGGEVSGSNNSTGGLELIDARHNCLEKPVAQLARAYN